MSTTTKPKSTVAAFHLRSRGTGVAQTVQEAGSTHFIQVDAAPAFGGNDENPSPIAYALSSLISCSQVTSQLVANDLGLKLNNFEFDIKASLDIAILVGGALEGNANFEWIEINVIVETDSSNEQFERLRQEIERRCPIFQLFLRSGVKITNHWSMRHPVTG